MTDTSLWPESNVTDRCRGGVEDGLDRRQVEAMGYTHRIGVGRSRRQWIPCGRVEGAGKEEGSVSLKREVSRVGG